VFNRSPYRDSIPFVIVCIVLLRRFNEQSSKNKQRRMKTTATGRSDVDGHLIAIVDDEIAHRPHVANGGLLHARRSELYILYHLSMQFRLTEKSRVNIDSLMTRNGMLGFDIV
jgi:hypothetical protein